MAYVARFATTAAKLEAYLARKLRERGWDEPAPPPIAAIVSRHVEHGFVDDAAYARMKARSLLARGYGSRRIEQALFAAGVDEELRGNAAPGEGRARRAALALAQRRRFGPFGDHPDPAPRDKQRDRQIAAMLRAGHGFDAARALVDADSAAAAQAWADEAQELGDDDEG